MTAAVCRASQCVCRCTRLLWMFMYVGGGAVRRFLICDTLTDCPGKETAGTDQPALEA